MAWPTEMPMNLMATSDKSDVGTHREALSTPHHVNDHGVVTSTRNDVRNTAVDMYIWNTTGPTSALNTCGALTGSANEPNATTLVETPIQPMAQSKRVALLPHEDVGWDAL